MQLIPPCGLCGQPKIRKEYNGAIKVGVQMTTVWLCPGCDLAPDPPLEMGPRP